jgi:hypothetical protein
MLLPTYEERFCRFQRIEVIEEEFGICIDMSSGKFPTRRMQDEG